MLKNKIYILSNQETIYTISSYHHHHHHHICVHIDFTLNFINQPTLQLTAIMDYDGTQALWSLLCVVNDSEINNNLPHTGLAWWKSVSVSALYTSRIVWVFAVHSSAFKWRWSWSPPHHSDHQRNQPNSICSALWCSICVCIHAGRRWLEHHQRTHSSISSIVALKQIYILSATKSINDMISMP